MLRTKIIKKNIKYDGRQLRSHWIFENFNLLGDSLVAFTGPSEVSENLVDIIDKKRKVFIYSPLMLNFMAEIFGAGLKEIILWQQLLVSIVFEEINKLSQKLLLERKGDDLFYKDKKLSVSIATVSPVSGLIHLGLNIKTDQKIPVKAVGLKALGIPFDFLARQVLKKFSQDFENMKIAAQKVKGVF